MGRVHEKSDRWRSRIEGQNAAQLNIEGLNDGFDDISCNAAALVL